MDIWISSCAFGSVVLTSILTTKHFGTSIELSERNNGDESPMTSKNLSKLSKSKKKSLQKMPRNDSEFSLGLDQHESISNALNELGEMCQEGKIVFKALGAISLVGILWVLAAVIIDKRSRR